MQTLTPEQSSAVNTPSTMTAVVASPGSGKTRVVIARVLRMIADGIDPATICVITFTNSAAREIEKRLICPACNGSGQIETGVEHGGLREMMTCDACFAAPIKLGYVGTVHGLMLRVVRMAGDLIGFPSTISVLDEDQTDTLLAEVMADLKIKPKPTMKEVRAALALGPTQLLGAELNTGANAIAAEYFQRIRRAGLLDFDSLLKFGAMALEEAARHARPLPWAHYLWDEFQDSGDDDLAIFNRLPGQSFFLVGDPDQSIYGFRGAKPENFNRLIANTSRFHVVAMQDNFRCSLGVCMSANQLIRNNPGRFEKETRSRTGETGHVKLMHCESEHAEAQMIAERLREIRLPNDCAILVRTNALADRFAKIMEGYGLPVKKRPDRQLPPDWKTARAFLALLAAPGNDLLAYWWIVRINGKPAADKIKLTALRGGQTINAVTIKLPKDTTPGRAVELLGQQGVGPESLDRVKAAIARLPSDATLVDLVFELGAELDAPEGEGLTVCTMHAAKGREWGHVFLPAFEDGTCPNRSKTSVMEEERRLAFVAFTRAKVELTVSHSQTRVPSWGSKKPEVVHLSPFVAETWQLTRAGHYPSEANVIE